MLCRRAEMLPIECIVRGYLTGSAWKEYQRERHDARHAAARRARTSPSQLPEPVFTPSTKAEIGARREHHASTQAVDLVGAELAEQARDDLASSSTAGARPGRRARASSSPTRSSSSASSTASWSLCDEVLTPDSSRFWPADEWKPGTHAAVVRQAAGARLPRALDWDKTPPPPPLPAEVVAATRARYVEAYERITGRRSPTGPA